MYKVYCPKRKGMKCISSRNQARESAEYVMWCNNAGGVGGVTVAVSRVIVRAIFNPQRCVLSQSDLPTLLVSGAVRCVFQVLRG